MKKHYTKPTAEPIALHVESLMLTGSTYSEDLNEAKSYSDDEEIEWE